VTFAIKELVVCLIIFTVFYVEEKFLLFHIAFVV